MENGKITFYQINSIIWAYQYFNEEYDHLLIKVANYFELMITRGGFNMALDVRQTIKLARSISIIDKNKEKFPTFWHQFLSVIPINE
jgi:hypothetical protein